MPRRTHTLLAGEYFLAVEGLAMIRTCLTDPSATAPRVDEIRGIVERFDEFPNSLAIPMSEHDVEDGYTRWAPTYDGPNPAIETEQPASSVRTGQEQTVLTPEVLEPEGASLA